MGEYYQLLPVEVVAVIVFPVGGTATSPRVCGLPTIPRGLITSISCHYSISTIGPRLRLFVITRLVGAFAIQHWPR